MENQTMTFGNYLKANKIVHIALVLGLVFFALISLSLHLRGFGTIGENFSKMAIYIIPIIAVIGFISSTLLFKVKLNDSKSKQSFKEKLFHYRSALILRYAIIEGTTLLTLISYLLTGELIVFAIAGILIIVFISYFPTKVKLINDLDLTFPDTQILDDPYFEIK